MKSELLHETQVGTHYVCPIEYGDMGDLKDWEIQHLEFWLEGYEGCVFEWGDEEEFARCDITDMMGACTHVKGWRPT